MADIRLIPLDHVTYARVASNVCILMHARSVYYHMNLFQSVLIALGLGLHGYSSWWPRRLLVWWDTGKYWKCYNKHDLHECILSTMSYLYIDVCARCRRVSILVISMTTQLHLALFSQNIQTNNIHVPRCLWKPQTWWWENHIKSTWNPWWKGWNNGSSSHEV